MACLCEKREKLKAQRRKIKAQQHTWHSITASSFVFKGFLFRDSRLKERNGQLCTVVIFQRDRRHAVCSVHFKIGNGPAVDGVAGIRGER